MEPHDQLVRTFIPLALLLLVIFLLGHRARLRDRKQHDDWWRQYRESERRTDLQHAWRARFVRYTNESEDEYVARFRSWLYDD